LTGEIAMKIAVIDPWHFTPPYDQELCQGLASIGHDVMLIGQELVGCDGQQARASANFTELGLFTDPGNQNLGFLRLIAKGCRHIQGLFRTLRSLRRFQPDVIHFQWLPLPLIDVLLIPLFRRIAPVVLTIHDSNPYNGAGPLLLRLGSMIATRSCDRWIVHNEVSERQMVARGLPMERLHRIAHGLLGPAVISSLKDKDEDDGRIHFVQFGKLKPYKGADILLNALGRLSDAQRTRCHVSIVGRPYFDTAPFFELINRHGLQSCVDLKLDFISDAEMSALFDRADMLVFPYRGIDTSGVLMAAIARGIPVVASDLGCFAEMLIDGQEGRLVKPADPKALAATLIDIVENPDNIKTMRAGMKALLQRIPSWQRIAETTTEVYELAQSTPSSTPIGAPM